MNVRIGNEGDSAEAARLHCSEISQGFLPTLGQPFLARLYRRMVLSPSAFFVVAEDAGVVQGFAAGTSDLGAFYRTFLVRDGLLAGMRSFHRVIRSLPRILEVLRYPASVENLPPAEILSVAVTPTSRGRGLGSRLSPARSINSTGAVCTRRAVVVGGDNAAAIALYRSVGFEPAVVRDIHAGTQSEVLVWQR